MFSRFRTKHIVHLQVPDHVLCSKLLMADPIHVAIRYHGTEVDNGTMAIDEVVDALQGFSSAYSKVASRTAPSNAQFQLRLSGIDKESFDLLILAAIFFSQSGDQMSLLQTALDASGKVLGLITSVMGLTKHTKHRPYNISVEGSNNTVLVLNADGAQMAVSPEALDIFKEKLIEGDLDKIAKPLRGNAVKSVELEAHDEREKLAGAEITSDEREYFRPEQSSTSVTKEAEIDGTLVSFNKDTNRGSFRLKNGNAVRYHFVGGDIDKFRADFANKGTVRAHATVEFDENLEPQRMDIQFVEALQRALLPPAES